MTRRPRSGQTRIRPPVAAQREARRLAAAEHIGSRHETVLLDAAGVPNAPTQTMDEVVVHPQTLALGMIESIAGTSLPFVGLPLSFNGSRPVASHPAPPLGADTAQLLLPIS